MENLSKLFQNSIEGVAFILIAIAMMLIVKLISDAIADKKTDHMIEEDNNLAVALRRAGLYLAIPLGMYGAIIGPSSGFTEDIKNLTIDGFAIIIFIFIARFISDKFILAGVNNSDEINKNNTAVGLTEFFGYLATGLIAQASFSGEGSVISGILFFALGQVVLVLATRIYEYVTPWSVIDCIRNNKASAGLMLGGVMFAVSIAIYGAINGNSVDLTQDVISFAIYATIAVLLLTIADKVVDPLFLPGTNIQTEIDRDNNVAAIVVIVATKIAVALMINAAVV